jgi:hypothetical protein
MELHSNAHIPDGLLAAMTLLSEKPRHGVTSWESAPHQGIDERNCTAAIGLRFRGWEIVSGTVVAPNNGQSYSFVKQWWKDVKNCVGNVALPTIANDLNPLSIGIGTGADIASQMSQASLAGAASWSVSRGLTVPLRSSIVRAGVASAETLGEVSGVLTMASVVYALGDAVVAEYNQCQ